MSQAAKEVTAGWNLKAFILIRMGLHPCTIYSWYSKKNQKKKIKKKKNSKKNKKKKYSKKIQKKKIQC